MAKRVFVHITKRNRNSLATALNPLSDLSGFSFHRLTDPSDVPPGSIVLFSFMTPDLEEVENLLKKLPADTLRVCGGPHPSADPYGCIKLGFDIVFVGEAEKIIKRVFRELAECSVRAAKFSSPKIVRGKPLETIDHIFPFFEPLGIRGYLEVMRGCPYRCAFCYVSKMFSGRVRFRSAESARAIAREFAKRGRKRVWILAPDAFSYGWGEPKALEKLLEAVSGEVEEVHCGSFPSEVRPNTVTREKLEVLRRFVSNGTIVVGLQSGSDRVLKLMRRDHTVSQGLRAVEAILEAGFVPSVDLIFAYPGETEEDMEKTVELAENLAEMGAKVHAHIYHPLPGTEPFGVCDENVPQWLTRALARLERGGKIYGSWAYQIDLRRKIIRWRREGKILT